VMKKILLIGLLLILTQPAMASSLCHGRFVNPFTDICWECMFPMTIGGARVTPKSVPDTENPTDPLCGCYYGTFYRIGLAIGYWEPARMVDVTAKPFCFVTLGGDIVNMGNVVREGTVANTPDRFRYSVYQSHWMIYPLLYWMNIIDSELCIEPESFDIAWLTEFDPTWQDDSWNFVINPEAALFSSLPMQAMCSLDCATVSTGGLPNDFLYWCAGCHGSMYPLTGMIDAHFGGIQASSLIAERLNFKLHRLGLAFDWATKHTDMLCYPHPDPILKKSNYRMQLVYPKAETRVSKGCNPTGKSTTLWESGDEYPYDGEVFGYLLWRKHNCCAA